MKNEHLIKNVLENLGFEKLNPMQDSAISAILTEPDVLLLSPTGSGKTVAFMLPLLELIKPGIKGVQVLIIVPSRELALQIEQVWKKMGTNYKVNVCYGGHSMDVEVNNLSNPPAVLIGTPGRLIDHIEKQSFDVNEIETLILDEYDKSLQMGFQDQMTFIIEKLNSLKKRIFVSATAEITIPSYTGFQSPKTLNFISENTSSDKLTKKLVISKEKDKIESLFNLICTLNSERALVFCNYRDASERISNLLNKKGIEATHYHGGMDQDDRERALIMFRNESVNYLITTDLAARGLDIPEMNHVIHYQLPQKPEEFTHRNGRTARMLATGTAYIILNEEEQAPEYLSPKIDVLSIPSGNTLPDPPEFETIYISGGKKNKLNKMDIVGFFSKKGKLQKGDLGLIEVKDFISFAAVKKQQTEALLENIKNEKMKGKKYKIEVARKVSHSTD